MELSLEKSNIMTKLLLKIDPLIIYSFLKLAKLAIYLLDIFLEHFFSFTFTGGPCEEQILSHLDYTKSAHVVDVHFCSWLTPIWQIDLGNFLYKHVRYGHPETEILLNDQATLLSVTLDGHAIFSVVNGVDIYDVDKFPFAFISQFVFAQRLVVVPTSALHHLAEQVGDPTQDVTLINMTGRCGSTLICQMLQRVPRTRVISEPYAFVHIHRLYQHNSLSEPEYERLLQSVARLQFKKGPGLDKRYERLIVKMTAQFNASQFQTIKKLFPAFTYFYITRSMRDSLKSYIKTYNVVSSPSIQQSLRKYFIFTLSMPYNDCKFRDHVSAFVNDRLYQASGKEINALVYTCNLAYFLRTKSDYRKIMLYEDFMDDPEREFRDLLEKLDMPTDTVPFCLEAMKRDSQRGVFGKRGNDSIVMNAGHWQMLDEMLAKFGVPLHSNMSREEFRQAILHVDCTD